MQEFKIRTTHFPLSQPLALALMAAASCGAWADEGGSADEPSPYYIGGAVAAMHDSNVYRVQDGPGAYYTRTGLVGGLDQKISRQRVYASADVEYNKYHNVDPLNHTSYGVKAGWDWETIEKLSGSFTGSANQNLATLNGNNLVQSTARNLEKTDQVAASIRWGGQGLITLEGQYGHSRVRYSDPTLAQDSSGDTGGVGAFYRLGPSTRLGAAVRYTHSVSPNGLGQGQELKSNGRNLDLTVDWRYSVQTNMNARLSWTRQTFSPEQPGLSGYSGLTGAIRGNYAPTAKLAFNVDLVRDAGINSTFFNNVASTSNTGAPSLSQNSEVTDTAGVGVRYAATAKIAAKAGYQFRHGKILNATTQSNEQTDNLRTASLGLTYDIIRNVQLSCSYSHESRSLSASALGTDGFSYTANVAGCMAQVVLR